MRKGISPVVGGIVIVVMAVLVFGGAVFIYQNFTAQMEKNRQEEVNKTQTQFQTAFKIDAVRQYQIVIKNVGQTTLQDLRAYVDGEGLELVETNLTIPAGETGIIDTKTAIQPGQQVRVVGVRGAEAIYMVEKSQFFGSVSLEKTQDEQLIAKISYQGTQPALSCSFAVTGEAGETAFSQDCTDATKGATTRSYDVALGDSMAKGYYIGTVSLEDAASWGHQFSSPKTYLEVCTRATCDSACETQVGCERVGCFWIDGDCASVFKSDDNAPEPLDYGIDPKYTGQKIILNSSWKLNILRQIVDVSMTLEAPNGTQYNQTLGFESKNWPFGKPYQNWYYNYSWTNYLPGIWKGLAVKAVDSTGNYTIKVFDQSQEVYNWIEPAVWANRRIIRLEEQPADTRKYAPIWMNVSGVDDCNLLVSKVDENNQYNDSEIPFQLDAARSVNGQCYLLAMFNLTPASQRLGYVYYNNRTVVSPRAYSLDLNFDPDTLCFASTNLKVCLWNTTNSASISEVALLKEKPVYITDAEIINPQPVGALNQNLLNINPMNGDGGIQPLVKYTETKYNCPCVYQLTGWNLLANGPLMKSIEYDFSANCTDVFNPSCANPNIYNYTYVVNLYSSQNYYDLLVKSDTGLSFYPQENPIFEPHIPLTHWNEELTAWGVKVVGGKPLCNDKYCVYLANESQEKIGAGLVSLYLRQGYKTNTLKPLNELVIEDGSESNPLDAPAGDISFTRAILNYQEGISTQTLQESTLFNSCRTLYPTVNEDFMVKCYNRNGIDTNTTEDESYELP